MNAASQAQSILIDPTAAWTRIEQEPGDPAYLLTYYVAPLALVPVICRFVGGCLIGVVVPGTGIVRAPIVDGVFGAILGYVAAFAVVLVVGLVIDLLAPRFGGRRDFSQAFKLAVYSFTPVWLSGIFLLLPGLRFLELTGCYGAYLLVKGLPRLMKSPPQAAHTFAAATVAFAAVLMWLAAVAESALFVPAGV